MATNGFDAERSLERGRIGANDPCPRDEGKVAQKRWRETPLLGREAFPLMSTPRSRHLIDNTAAKKGGTTLTGDTITIAPA
jgi:hypothetical protein